MDFLVQVQRGRVLEARKKKGHGRAGRVGWAGVLLMCAVMGVAQTPSSTPSVTRSAAARTSSYSAGRRSPAPQAQQPANAQQAPELEPIGPALGTSVWQWKGLIVEKIEFAGVVFEKGDKLPEEMEQKAGQPLDPEKMRQSLRRLFDSGRYRDIEVRGIRQGNRVTLIFAGRARLYVGRVTVEGVKSDQLTTLLQYATKMSPGAAVTQGAVAAGSEGIKQTLEQQGYYESRVSVTRTVDVPNSQVNLVYTVMLGPQARVGQVAVEGTVGMTPEEFRKKGKLKQGNKVSRETASNAMARLHKLYQKRNRLEATVTLQKQTYIPARKQVDYEFVAHEGPEVKVAVEGIKVSTRRLHLLVPIFEEGTIDNDLLNESVYNIHNYVQQQGYFDAKVGVRVIGQESGSESVVFTVDRGIKHKVVAVDIKGNHYFGTDILRERMQVKKADAYQRSGRYSPSMVEGDVSSIKALYRANGFDQAQVTTDVKDIDQVSGKEIGEIRVMYTVVEGPQQKFGSVDLVGVDPSREKDIRALINAQTGQPFSLITLSGDREAVVGYYLSHGFDQAKVEIRQQKEDDDANVTNVSLNVVEGQQVFINRVLVSGLVHTKPKVVANKILVHPGDPLDQNALLETQRGLYGLALFNEVVTAVQNPDGNAPQKNALVQITEAKRWNVTYGFGFEAETGYPGTINQTNAGYSQEGKAGVSPRISLDVSRINFRGTEDSLTLHSAYGMLEQVAVLTFQNPHLRGSQTVSASVSGGYTNIRDITTFASSTLQGDFRVTQKWGRKDTFIYQFLYRRVKVDPKSLQVSVDLIPLLSQPVRVGGPGITWFHDTRSPSPLNAVKGSYTTVQFFDSSSKVGSETDFFKLDGTNSTYYRFNKDRYVLARSTRIGYQGTSGPNPNAGNPVCEGVLLNTNPTCNAVPLPERLYAGGASSLRGFPINGAGPRDLQTGYPVGGSAVFVNSIEFRMPPPTLPYVGDSVSFVLFHDMGNVFQNPKDLFPSFLRFNQPNRGTCKDVSGTIGTCNFNYFTHAVGLGARYRTPVGPIRFDFSYNLNPPIYPVINDYTNNSVPHVGQANHFNFFFSIGQTF
ncbi:POTRA domain-containing protein [Edaphobacter bradus]|uniref:POTRA domain-containing protein n=1 Tax=Edaphobacter bradus TaxID=2259016 RepID=UPI0021DFE9CB|nr:POTRA domain-containing protein [Edaphobacter bradus]